MAVRKQELKELAIERIWEALETYENYIEIHNILTPLAILGQPVTMAERWHVVSKYCTPPDRVTQAYDNWKVFLLLVLASNGCQVHYDHD